MALRVEKIKPSETDELISFLNKAFTGDHASGHFENNMPRMCNSEKRLCEHYILRENGHICSAVGVFPYDVTIGTDILRFATVGNVAVAEKYRGKGYMRFLMTAAMQMLDEENIDVSRLGGLRSRYEIYGYEPCGVRHQFVLTSRNISDIRKQTNIEKYSFSVMSEENIEALETAEQLYLNNAIHLHRSASGSFFDSLRMWGCIPYTAYDNNGHISGYLCTDSSGTKVHEYGCVDENKLFDMLCSYAVWREQDISYTVYPWNISIGYEFAGYSETYQIDTPSNFKVLNWEKLISALMNVKNKIKPLPSGELRISISDYGTLHIATDGNQFNCEKEPEEIKKTSLCFDHFSMTKLCFSSYPQPFILNHKMSMKENELIGMWFPLPLSWNKCDNL